MKSNYFATIVTRLGSVNANIAALGLFAILFLTVYETVARYVFERPPIWAIDYPSFTLTLVVALTLAYTQRVRGHVATGVIEAAMSPRGRTILAVCLYPVYIAISGFLTWASLRWLSMTIVEWRLSLETEIPLVIPHSLILIGFILLDLQLLVDFGQALSALRRGVEYRMTRREGEE